MKERGENELKTFELVAGDVLLELGYPIHTDRSNKKFIAEENLPGYFKEN